jgi:hypothetical protein
VQVEATTIPGPPRDGRSRVEQHVHFVGTHQLGSVAVDQASFMELECHYRSRRRKSASRYRRSFGRAPRLSRDHCSPSDRRCRSRFDRAAGLTRCMGSRTRGAVAVVHGLQTHLAGKAPSKRAAGVDCKSTEAKQMPSQCMSSRVEGWSVRYQEAKMLAF